MEMERINDDTIRVFMNLDELNDRGIKMLDLIKDHKRVEDFFYSVLDEVDTKHTFVNEGPVTFQVMPSGTGLEIFISKGQPDQTQNTADSDDETQDTAATPNVTSQSHAPKHRAAEDDQDGQIAHDSLEQFFPEGVEDGRPDSGQPETFFGNQLKRSVTLELKSFDDMVALAQELYLNGGTSDLYKYQGKYYVVLTFERDLVDDFDAERQANLAHEYGDTTKVDADVLSEYGEQLMDGSALEITRYYF